MATYLNDSFDLNSDTLVEVFDELPLWSAPFGLKLLESIRFKKNITALDIGFGAGFPLTEIAMRLGKTCKVYGIDPWEAAIRRTKRKINFYKIENIEIIQGTLEDIDLADNSIDLITSNNGVNNIANLEKALGQCYRILRSEGQFVQTINLNNTMIEFYEVFEEVLSEMNLNDSIKKMKSQIYRMRKPLDQFIEYIEKAGFQIEKVTSDKFEYKFTDGTTMLNHHSIRMSFLDGWKSAVSEKDLVKVFQSVENKLNILSQKTGFFKLSVPFVVINSTKA